MSPEFGLLLLNLKKDAGRRENRFPTASTGGEAENS